MRKKRIYSAAACAAVLCNFLAGMPTAAFAAEAGSYSFVYDNYTVSYSVTDTWTQAEQVSVTITNTGDSTIENWMLVYEDFDAEIGDIWNAAVTETESGRFYLRNAGYNANIEPNTSVSFGCVLNGADTVPSDILMQQTRVTASDDDYDVSLHVMDDWGPAFNAEIVLRNNSDQPLEWWELDFNTNFTISEITSSWAAASEKIGEDSYRFKGTYNGIIPPHTAVSLGFSAVKHAAQETPEISAEALTNVIFGGFPEKIDAEAERQAEREYIESLNENAEYPVEFAFNSDGTVNSIDGIFTELSVQNAESAKASLKQIEYLLGMQNTGAVLVFDNAYTDEENDYTVFFFHEEFRGIPVLDARVSIVARNSGEVLSLSSSFADIPSDFSIIPTVSAAEIAAAYPDTTVTLNILPALNKDETDQLAYVSSGSNGDMVLSAEDGSLLQARTVVSDDEEPADVEVLNPGTPSNKIERDGDLVYCRGQFGKVQFPAQNATTLYLTPDEKNELKINHSDITFRFAEKKEAYFRQVVKESDYDEFVKSHKASRISEDGSNYIVDIAANEYHFDQMYQGYQVYGRVITETVNDKGQTFIMDSNVLSVDELTAACADIKLHDHPTIESVKLANPELNELKEERSEPVLYTWESFEADPAWVFIFLNEEENRTYLVSAEDANYGDILNRNDDSYQLGKGLDEGNAEHGRTLRYFPLVTTKQNTHVLGFSKNLGDCTGSLVLRQKERYFTNGESKINSPELFSESTYFYEPEAVASYLNVRRAYDFYVTKFHHCLNENGKNHTDFTLYINYKCPTTPGAAASAGNGEINFFPRNEKYCSKASDSPWTVAHEYTHSIFHAFNGGFPPQYCMTRGINEGYAYAIGYSVFTDFKQTHFPYMAEPMFDVDFSSNTLRDLIDAGHTTKDGHTIAQFLYYAAVLMHDGGMDTDTIGEIYYHSLVLGTYTPLSTLNTFRVNIIKACKVMKLSEAKITAVRNALNKIWEYDSREFFATVNVRDYEDHSIVPSGTNIVLRKNMTTAPLRPMDDGRYKIEPGERYMLEVSAPGYITYRNVIHMYYTENRPTVDLVPIHYDSTYHVKEGKANVRTIDVVTNLPSAAVVTLETYDENFRRIVVCDEQGHAVKFPTDAVTGETGTFSFAPGYYFAEAETSDHYFVQPIMTIPSGNEEPDHIHVLYDSRMNGGPRSYFNDIHVDEFHEIETEFNLFNTMDVLADTDTYEGVSGLSQFGRGMFLVFYEPDTPTDFQIVFKPTPSQMAMLEDILCSENNLQIDYETGEKQLGHYEWVTVGEESVYQLVTTPNRQVYYNADITAGFDIRSYGPNSHVTVSRQLTAFELYQGLQENHGVYTLFTVHAEGDGKLTVH